MFKPAVKKVAKPRLIRVLFILLLIISSSIGFLMYYRYRSNLEDLMIQQAQERQLVLAKASSKAIEVYLNDLERALYTMQKISERKDITETDLRIYFRQFVDISSKYSPVVSMTRFNKDGITTIVENTTRDYSVEEKNYSDRMYYQWAKKLENRGLIYISDPFIARGRPNDGQTAFVAATPVYINNKFDGLIMVMTTLSEFDRFFIRPLTEVSDNSGQMVIVDSKGVVLASSKQIDRLQETEIYQQLLHSKLLQQEQGSVELPVVSKDQNVDSRLVTYKSIQIGNQMLFLLLIAPLTSITNQIDLFSRINAIWVIGLAVVTLFACLLFVLMESISHKAGYQRGILNGIVIAIESVRKHIGTQKHPVKKHQA
jgi:hypothetical protein